MPLHQLALFGGFHVLDGNAQELTIASRKGRSLLAHVALTGTAGVPRERLAGVFWGDADEGRARQSLRQSLSRLRREVGPLLIDRGRRLLCEAGLCNVDALAFESLAAQTDTQSLEHAVTSFRGPLLDGIVADCGDEFDDWLQQERCRFEAMSRRAYERLLRLYEGCTTTPRWRGLQSRRSSSIPGRNRTGAPGCRRCTIAASRILNELLDDGVRLMTTTRRLYNFRYRDAAHWIAEFRTMYGPIHKLFASLDGERQGSLERDLTTLLIGHDIGGDNGLVVPSEYLEVVAQRR